MVRVALGQSAATSNGRRDTFPAVVLETNVDDLDPRVWPSVLTALIDLGASDAWLTPILMKKGRPAYMLSVLVPPELVDTIRDQVFTLVPTLGIRESPVAKTALERTWRTVEVTGGEVRIKLGLHDGTIVSAAPEYEDVARVAREVGLPERLVLAQAVAAAGAAGLSPTSGSPGSWPTHRSCVVPFPKCHGLARPELVHDSSPEAELLTCPIRVLV